MEMLDVGDAMLRAAFQTPTCGEAELGDCCISPGATNRNRRSPPFVIDRVDGSADLAPARIWHLSPGWGEERPQCMGNSRLYSGRCRQRDKRRRNATAATAAAATDEKDDDDNMRYCRVGQHVTGPSS